MSRFLLALLTALAVPGTASAYTVVKVSQPAYGDPPRLSLEGTDEPSQITVGIAPGAGKRSTISIADPVGRLVAGRNCVAADDHALTCASAYRYSEFDAELRGGDDSLTATAPAAAEVGWVWIEVDTGDGVNRADISAIPRQTGYTFLSGGNGPDELLGSASRDHIFGAGGDNVITGGDGDDMLAGGDGADRLQGGNGPDHLKGGVADTLFEGGPGDDAFAGTHPLEGACGDGVDSIWLQADATPGPLVDGACERVCYPSPGYEDCNSSDRDGRIGDAHPTVSGRELSWRMRVPCDRRTCRARLALSWQGEVVATTRIRSRHRFVTARLTVPPALADAIAAGPQELALSLTRIAIRRQDYPYRIRSRSVAWRVTT